MASKKETVLVSACLLGVACRYDGKARGNHFVMEWLQGKSFVPVCPESLSGLPVPREPAEYEGGDGTAVRAGKARILLRDGRDVTARFLRGAQECLKISRLVRPKEAVLKDRSPSCGVHHIYERGRLVPGVGCFTALLLLEGVPVKSEKDIEELLKKKK